MVRIITPPNYFTVRSKYVQYLSEQFAHGNGCVPYSVWIARHDGIDSTTPRSDESFIQFTQKVFYPIFSF